MVRYRTATVSISGSRKVLQRLVGCSKTHRTLSLVSRPKCNDRNPTRGIFLEFSKKFGRILMFQVPEESPSTLFSKLSAQSPLLPLGLVSLAVVAALSTAAFACLLVCYFRQRKAIYKQVTYFSLKITFTHIRRIFALPNTCGIAGKALACCQN